MLTLELLEHIVGADLPAFVDRVQEFGLEPKDAHVFDLLSPPSFF